MALVVKLGPAPPITRIISGTTSTIVAYYVMATTVIDGKVVPYTSIVSTVTVAYYEPYHSGHVSSTGSLITPEPPTTQKLSELAGGGSG